MANTLYKHTNKGKSNTANKTVNGTTVQRVTLTWLTLTQKIRLQPNAVANQITSCAGDTL